LGLAIDRMMNAQERIARALYYTYAEITHPPHFYLPRWLDLSDRHQAGWLAVAEMTTVLVNSAKHTGEGLK